MIRDATVHRLIVPVLCGSALDFIGIQPLLDAVMYYLPSPADVPPVEGTDPKKAEKKLVRKPIEDEPFCGLVFKMLAEKTGDLYFVRVYSGTLKANSRVLNPGKDKKENAAQLYQIQADRRKQVPNVAAGDIVGIIGPRVSVTGDTLCDDARTDPAGVDSFSGNGHQHGDRAGDVARAQEAGRHAGDAQAAGPHVPRHGKRRDRARRSSAAWASCTWK